MNKICAFGDSVMKGIVEDYSRVTDSIKYIISNFSFAELCSLRLGLDIKNYARFGGTINQGMDLVEKHKDEILEAEQNGERRGERRGQRQGQEKMGALIAKLIQAGRTEDALRASTDEAYRERLFAEYQIV